jgi:hypothetical protein
MRRRDSLDAAAPSGVTPATRAKVLAAFLDDEQLVVFFVAEVT